MGSETKIEWTDATWSPAQGCTKVDGDCKFCYMYRDKERYGQDPTKVIRSAPATFNSILNPKKYPPGALVFSAPWADWWHPDCDAIRPDAFAHVDKRRDLTFQILTKRPERIAGTLPESWGADGWPHVWLGISVGSPKGAERARVLADIPAVVRFLSIEPLWAPGVAASIRDVVASGRIDWIILGGESGPHARPMHPQWAREVRDLAAEFKVPLLFKQWGEWAPVSSTNFGAGPHRLRRSMLADGRVLMESVSAERDKVLDADGLRTWHADCEASGGNRRGYQWMELSGKKAAGRTLDGVIHDGYPTPRVPHV